MNEIYLLKRENKLVQLRNKKKLHGSGFFFHKFYASQILLDGLSEAMPDPAPKLSYSNVVGISLEASMANVGAHSSLQSSNPLNLVASIQVWNASTLSSAVTAPSAATQSKKAASQLAEHGAVIPMQPTCQYSLFFGS